MIVNATVKAPQLLRMLVKDEHLINASESLWDFYCETAKEGKHEFGVPYSAIGNIDFAGGEITYSQYLNFDKDGNATFTYKCKCKLLEDIDEIKQDFNHIQWYSNGIDWDRVYEVKNTLWQIFGFPFPDTDTDKSNWEKIKDVMGDDMGIFLEYDDCGSVLGIYCFDKTKLPSEDLEADISEDFYRITVPYLDSLLNQLQKNQNMEK